MSSHNCNEIRNKMLLKTEQNYFWNLTFQIKKQNFIGLLNCNEIMNKILLKTEQNF